MSTSRGVKFSLFFLLLAGLMGPYVAAAAPANRAEASQELSYIIKLNNPASLSSVAAEARRLGGTPVRQIADSPLFVLTMPADKAATLAAHPAIAFLAADHALPAAYTPNDPYAAQQWHLQTVNAPAAWDTTRGSGAVTIAILDTGLDVTHPEFAGRVLDGYNTYARTTDVSDAKGHGTWVAGAAAASIDNGTGIAGIADAVKILPIKVTDATGTGYTLSVAEGLYKAAELGAQIANVSFEIYGGDPAITEAARHFTQRGGIVFAAAGNDGAQHVDAENPYIVSVASTGKTNELSRFASYGAYVDFVAPGESIGTTGMNATYVGVTGSSFASPIAAGVAALVWSANPSLTNAQVLEIMRASAQDLDAAGRDARTGSGLVNAGEAVRRAARVSSVIQQPTPAEPVIARPAPALPSIPTVDAIAPDAPLGEYASNRSLTFALPANGARIERNTHNLWVDGPQSLQIQRVDFFVGATYMGSATSYPFLAQWDTRDAARFPAGNYTLTARVITTSGIYSATTLVTITDPKPQTVTRPATRYYYVKRKRVVNGRTTYYYVRVAARR